MKNFGKREAKGKGDAKGEGRKKRTSTTHVRPLRMSIWPRGGNVKQLKLKRSQKDSTEG